MKTITPKRAALIADRAALIERIKVAAAALDIPQEAVDDVTKHGTSYHLSRATGVLVAFADEYGVSLDYLISGNLDAMFRCTSLLQKAPRSNAA